MPDFSRIIIAAYHKILGRPPDPDGLGHYNQIMDAGLTEAAMRESLLRSPEYADEHPSPLALGLNVHIPTNAILWDVATNLGLRWIRVDFDWFRIEPEQGRFRLGEWDRLVTRATELGLNILAVLAYTPAWASSTPLSAEISDPPRAGLWVDTVTKLVGRYPQIRHWQLWNEPNITDFWMGSANQYRTEILEPGAAAARAVSPDVQIVAPGLAHIRDWRGWFAEACKAETAIDIVNHHNYQGSGREVVLELERDTPGRPSFRTLAREFGVDDRPFWLTETGRRSADGNQLAYYQDVAQILEQRIWIDRLFFFHYWDGPGGGDGGYGIVNEDFSPKAAHFFLSQRVNAV
jgi:hypothetical protein